MSTSNIHSALFSVRETFGNSEDAEEEGEGSEDGMSSKSSFSSRFPRPSIEMEYDIDGKTEVKCNILGNCLVSISEHALFLLPILYSGATSCVRSLPSMCSMPARKLLI